MPNEPKECSQCGIGNAPTDVLMKDGVGWAPKLQPHKGKLICRKCRGEWPFCDRHPHSLANHPMPPYIELPPMAAARRTRRSLLYPIPYTRLERVSVTYNMPPSHSVEDEWLVWRFQPNDAHTWAFVHYCKSVGQPTYVKGNQRRVHVATRRRTQL